MDFNILKRSSFQITYILQDSSFSNQRTFILHIQGVFNLPGTGFRQLIKSTSSVPITLNDVIVDVRQVVNKIKHTLDM